jgi:hypothetical protein
MGVPRTKKIDHTRYETAEYWNQVLADFGLSVDAGRHPNLIPVGGSDNLSLISDLESSNTGRVKPKPRSE